MALLLSVPKSIKTYKFQNLNNLRPGSFTQNNINECICLELKTNGKNMNRTDIHSASS